MAKAVPCDAEWHIQIKIAGRRESGTFRTRRGADAWAARRKAEMLSESGGLAGEGKTLADALRRYAEEVSPHKRGARTEVIRLRAFVGQHLFPALVLLSDLTPAHLALAAWRDERLRVNSRGSVLRDMTTVSGVLEVARREWQWIGANPLADVRRPAHCRGKQEVGDSPSGLSPTSCCFDAHARSYKTLSILLLRSRVLHNPVFTIQNKSTK